MNHLGHPPRARVSRAVFRVKTPQMPHNLPLDFETAVKKNVTGLISDAFKRFSRWSKRVLKKIC